MAGSSLDGKLVAESTSTVEAGAHVKEEVGAEASHTEPSAGADTGTAIKSEVTARIRSRVKVALVKLLINAAVPLLC